MNLHDARQRLLAAKTEIQDRLERTHKHIRRGEPVSQNFHEQVVETANDQVVQALEQDGLRDLLEIDKALRRIDSGAYPYCSACGEAIDEERLVALPWTEFCARCV